MSALNRIRRRKQAKKTIQDFINHPENVAVIHYSCESFYDRQDGRTPRITSIAILSLAAHQTHSFSIHKVAEQSGIPAQAITAEYDRLEREMLDEFFEFIRLHETYKWVHWNMRDVNYGFAAIEHRYRVLGGKPIRIDDSKKYDLANLLIIAFGVGYIGHPRLEKLVDKNKIAKLNFLNGAQEAEAFENKEYVKLHQSTLRKVDMMANIIGRVAEGMLKTNSRWYEIYGISPAAIGEIIKDHWLFVVIGFLAAIASIVSLVHGDFTLSKSSSSDIQKSSSGIIINNIGEMEKADKSAQPVNKPDRK